MTCIVAALTAVVRSGYRTGFMGKNLNGYRPSEPPQPGWDAWDVTGYGYPEFRYSLHENGHSHYFRHAASDYLTDVLPRRASTFVANSASTHTPFMLGVATFAPHSPYTPSLDALADCHGAA